VLPALKIRTSTVPTTLLPPVVETRVGREVSESSGTPIEGASLAGVPTMLAIAAGELDESAVADWLRGPFESDQI